MKRKIFFVFLAALIFAKNSFAEETDSVSLVYSGRKTYSLVERTDLRKYVNGKYSGLTSREVRSFVSPSEPPSRKYRAKGSAYENDLWFDGSFYVEEETLRDRIPTAKGVYGSIPSMFHISPDGNLTMFSDNGYPSFRSFPSFPAEKISAGDSWKSEAERAVDPLNKGVFTRLKMPVSYTFAGEEIYKGQPVYRIKAKWQTNYGGNTIDFRGDASLKTARGGHSADIIVLKENCVPILILDQVDETFLYSDGTEVTFKGRITNFTEFPPSVDSEKIETAAKKFADRNGSVVTEKTDAGIRLSIRNIKFEPDSAVISESEKSRLDEIAEILKLAPDAAFLVEGFTANVGRPEGEQKLSEERARKVAEELKIRGLESATFIYRGRGSGRSVASNETEEGRAQNRRVEITILSN